MNKSFGEQLAERVAAMSSEERADMLRSLMGEDKDDLLLREDIREIIRDLRVSPVQSYDYQRALTDVMSRITKLKGIRNDQI